MMTKTPTISNRPKERTMSQNDLSTSRNSRNKPQPEQDEGAWPVTPPPSPPSPVLPTYLAPSTSGPHLIAAAAESDMELDLLAESESDSESEHSQQGNSSIQRSAVTAATAGSDAGKQLRRLEAVSFLFQPMVASHTEKKHLFQPSRSGQCGLFLRR